MLMLLIRARLRCAYNAMVQGINQNRLAALGIGVAVTVVFFGVFIGFLALFNLSSSPAAMRDMVNNLFFFLFMFLFAGSVPFVASTLLQAGDYLLLSAAPIRSSSVVAAKLLDATITNSLQFTVIGCPAMLACAVYLHFSLAAWILLPLVVALFILIPALLTSVILLIALGIFGPKRVGSAISTVNIVLAAVVCLTIVSQINNMPVGPGIMPRATEPHIASSTHAPISSWFAHLVISMGNGNWVSVSKWLLGLSLLTAMLFAVGMFLGGKLLGSAAAVEDGGGRIARPEGKEIAASRTGLLRMFSPPVAAIIAKDLRYILRDTVLPGQMAMPIILYLVPFVLALQPSVRSMVTHDELASISLGMIVIVIYMQTSILSLTCIGLEGRSYGMLMNSPNHARTILVAKFWMSTLVTTGLGLTLVTLDGLILQQKLWQIGVEYFIVVVSCASLCGMGVGLSASLPRFTYENPAHRVSVWALIFGFFGSAGYSIAMTLALGVPIYLRIASQIDSLWPMAIGVSVFVGLSTLFGLVPMIIGSDRLDRYQWEH
ncbi:MAG: hypothetical protein ABJA67_12345 [Chthonomonadales bacterium]